MAGVGRQQALKPSHDIFIQCNCSSSFTAPTSDFSSIIVAADSQPIRCSSSTPFPLLTAKTDYLRVTFAIIIAL
jgi:hypothetical protein